ALVEVVRNCRCPFARRLATLAFGSILHGGRVQLPRAFMLLLRPVVGTTLQTETLLVTFALPVVPLASALTLGTLELQSELMRFARALMLLLGHLHVRVLTV